MLISLFSLAAMDKIQKNTQTKVNIVGLTNINTKESQNTPPFMKVIHEAEKLYSSKTLLICISTVTLVSQLLLSQTQCLTNLRCSPTC